MTKHMGLLQSQQSMLSSREQQLQGQLHALEASLVDKGNVKYNNLMTESEKKWLVKIQAKIMQSDNPYVDDFYFHALNRKKAAMMFQKAPPMPNPFHSKGHAQGRKGGKNQKEKATHEPTAFTNTLGKLKTTNFRSPAMLIATPTRADLAETDALADEDNKESREAKQKTRRRQALLVVEAGYRYLLASEDVTYNLEQGGHRMGKKTMTNLQAKRTASIDAAYALLDVINPTAVWKGGDDSNFRRIIEVSKGQALLGRLLPLFNPFQRHAVIAATIRLASGLVAPRAGDKADTEARAKQVIELMRRLLPGICHALKEMPLPMLTSLVQTMVAFHPAEEESRCDGLLHEFGATIVYTTCRTADAQLGGGGVPPQEQEAWTASVDKLAVNLAASLARGAKTPQGQGLFELASIFAAHGGEAGRAALKEAGLHKEPSK